jgi:NAD(P)-dependent dehydrogenase (short-subunit alcohol dehydrogenase family)
MSPAAVKTYFYEAMGFPKGYCAQLFEYNAPQYSLGRVAESEEISNAILYLASDESSFVTGINMILDGGSLFP